MPETLLARLTAAGTALHGLDWQRATARSLGAYHPDGAHDSLDARLVRRWVSGERPVPAWVGEVLPQMLSVGASARVAEAATLSEMATEMGGERPDVAFSKSSLVSPIFHVEQIERSEANHALTEWSHKMGPCKRPMGIQQAHGVFAHGKLVGVTVTADLVSATCAGFTRKEAIELARLCASRRDLCRPILRIWREFVFPSYAKPWAVSYQDEALHTGDTYRFDGWIRLREHAHSGPDRHNQGGDKAVPRKGRTKTIWGWHQDADTRAARRVA